MIKVSFKLFRLSTLLVTILCFLAGVHDSAAQVSSEGRDFWVGFFDNSDEPDQALEIYLISSHHATVVLETPLGDYTNTKALTPGRSSLVILPRELRSARNGISDNGIHITSDQDISVYAINKRATSADASTIYPTRSLGKEYYAMAHAESQFVDGSSGSNLVLVGTEDNSEIEIIPSTNAMNGWNKGETHTITLNRGQVFDLRAAGDLSGTFLKQVQGDNGFALFGGSEFTNVSNCGTLQDHLYEQVPPLTALGKKYLPVPYTKRNGGDLIKIVAPFNNTLIKIEGYADIELNAADTYTIIDFDEARFIESNKPILVAQLSKSSDCDGASISDPFLINLAPVQQRVKQFNFTAFNASQIQEYYISVITAECSNGKVYLDNQDITDQMEVLDGTRYGVFQVSPGDHFIDSDEGVLIYIYGYGREEAYGYLAGIQSFSEEVDLLVDGQVIEPGLKVCAQTELTFDASFLNVADPLNLYDTYIWDFGDGTEATGLSVTHTYEEGGVYDVILYVSDGQERCANLAFLIPKSLEVSGFGVENLEGPQSVCEFATGIQYRVNTTQSNSYQWTVEGGTIVSGANADQVTVDWDGSNANARLRLIVQNSDGCFSRPIDYPVVVDNQLQPAVPKSAEQYPNEACANQGVLKTYFVNPTNGSTYQWFTNTNGSIQGNSNGSSVSVNWGNTGVGKLWYTERNPSISDCEGVSDTLYVDIYDQLTITETVINPACFAESNGRIDLTINGGKPGSYLIEWEDGFGSSTTLTQLESGQYRVLVTDEIACSVEKVINLVDPPVLELIDAMIQGPLCYEDDNGQVTLLVGGGTLFANNNYQYEWSGNGLNRQTNEGFLDGLSPGDYQVKVTDANGCNFTHEFEVSETTELAADLSSFLESPACPGENNGIGYMQAKGGTPDYQFYWSNTPTIDNQRATGLAAGDYTVRIVDANGCEINVQVNIPERQPKVYVPNAFSPNGDGNNEVFKPVADCALSYAMQIYNKWGTVIFATEELDEGWDGSYNGDPVQPGNYSYIIFYTTEVNGRLIEDTYRGTLKLVR
ncbi:PKD domain-containing protein [Roseivirga sp.]|uniref:PKD domain-containing protein n=1 Tax=Roseivirga sp. TaxID=1964215 RepID=UPI003B5191C0